MRDYGEVSRKGTSRFHDVKRRCGRFSVTEIFVSLRLHVAFAPADAGAVRLGERARIGFVDRCGGILEGRRP